MYKASSDYVMANDKTFSPFMSGLPLEESCFSGALPSIDNLTCSIGGCRFAYGQNIEDVYAKADQLLYEAKKKGRNCYVLGKL